MLDTWDLWYFTEYMDCIYCVFKIQPIMLYISGPGCVFAFVASWRSLLGCWCGRAFRRASGPACSTRASFVSAAIVFVGAHSLLASCGGGGFRSRTGSSRACSSVHRARWRLRRFRGRTGSSRACSSLRRARWRIAAAAPGPAWLAGAAA